MQRVFHSREDHTLFNRSTLPIIAACSAVAFMAVVAPSQTQKSVAVAQQTDHASRCRAARRYYATQDADMVMATFASARPSR